MRESPLPRFPLRCVSAYAITNKKKSGSRSSRTGCIAPVVAISRMTFSTLRYSFSVPRSFLLAPASRDRRTRCVCAASTGSPQRHSIRFPCALRAPIELLGASHTSILVIRFSIAMFCLVTCAHISSMRLATLLLLAPSTL